MYEREVEPIDDRVEMSVEQAQADLNRRIGLAQTEMTGFIGFMADVAQNHPEIAFQDEPEVGDPYAEVRALIGAEGDKRHEKLDAVLEGVNDALWNLPDNVTALQFDIAVPGERSLAGQPDLGDKEEANAFEKRLEAMSPFDRLRADFAARSAYSVRELRDDVEYLEAGVKRQRRYTITTVNPINNTPSVDEGSSPNLELSVRVGFWQDLKIPLNMIKGPIKLLTTSQPKPGIRKSNVLGVTLRGVGMPRRR